VNRIEPRGSKGVGRCRLVLASAAPPLLLAALLQPSSCPGTASPGRASPTPAYSPTAVPPTPVPATPTAVPDLFATRVRPIVQSRCAPCHEPGGKMYTRLPFDDPKVLSSHSDGVLRRLKGEDREAFEAWLASTRSPR